MNVEKEIQKIDKAIAELVYKKTALRKAYNYYHGHRDHEQFKHMEENYGIGVPTGVTFNPLVRPHIDRLIGEYLGLNQRLTVTCKDDETMSYIMRDKQLEITNRVVSHLKKFIENNIIGAILDNKDAVMDPYLEAQLTKIREEVGNSFTSKYEIAAHKILTYLRQSKNIDLDNKMQNLLTDLCISGTCYYRVRPSNGNNNVQLEVLNPLNTFVEKNPNSEYLADSYRVVVRRYMSVEDIIMEFHDELSKEDIALIKEQKSGYSTEGSSVYIQGTSSHNQSVWNANHKGILGGLEVHPMYEDSYVNINTSNMWTVYEVEWIELNYSTGEQIRHEGVRIGDSIYITRGESEYVIRTKDNPNKCRLSVNGLFFLDKNGEPNSMIIKTMDLQDKYDLLCFYRDNIIASSGTVGDWVDLAFVPQVLGVDLPERLQKWLAYKKQGMALIDSSQDGAQMMNTIFNGYDDSVKAQSIQAISLAMTNIQHQVSMVTGVLPEALAQYEQRDAVSNVQLGVRTTLLLTKQLFKAMDVIYNEVNYDMLNLAKLIWKDGITGTIILGNTAEIFTALPEHYTNTDFDVHMEDSTESYQQVQALAAMSAELVKAGAADLRDITNIVTATSMTELKQYVDKSITKKQEEANAVNQLQQQLQQYEQTIKQYEQQMTQLQQQNAQLAQDVQKNDEFKRNLESAKLNLEREKIKNDKEYNDKAIKVKEQQVQAQVAEMFDGNPYNNKIKSVI